MPGLKTSRVVFHHVVDRPDSTDFKFSMDLAPWLSSIPGRGIGVGVPPEVFVTRLRVKSYGNSATNAWALRVLNHPKLRQFTHTVVNGEDTDDLLLAVLSADVAKGKGEFALNLEDEEGVWVDTRYPLNIEAREMTSLFDVGTPIIEVCFEVTIDVDKHI